MYFCPVCVARFVIIPLWHKSPGKAPLTSAIWLSHTTLGYTVAHSVIDWGVEGQLFNTSEQQVLLSSWPFSCLVSVPPKNVSYLFPSACWFKPDSICPHSPCNTPLCFWCNPDSQTGCNWDLMGDITHVLVGKRWAFKKNIIFFHIATSGRNIKKAFSSQHAAPKDWQMKIKTRVPYH